MDDANVGMLPVVLDGKVLGVITDRDIVIRAVAREADPASTAVGDCLSIHAIVAHPDWTTDRAMQTMAQAQIGRLPVLDDNERLVGVVTLSSMAFRAPDKEEALETARGAPRIARRTGGETRVRSPRRRGRSSRRAAPAA